MSSQLEDQIDDPIETAEEQVGHDQLVYLQRVWSAKIEQAEKDRQDFVTEVERSIKLHTLNVGGRRRKATGDRLNIAWANYEILRQATYSRAPKVVVSPRFGGGPRRQQLNAVAEVVERTVMSNNDRSDLHSVLCLVRDDMLKAGRGVPWLRYEAQFEDQPIPGVEAPDDMGQHDNEAGEPMPGNEAGEAEYEPPMMQVKVGERVVPEFVAWRDYLEGKAETWAKVPWVARRVPMTKDAFEDRFGTEAIARCGVAFSGDDGQAGYGQPVKPQVDGAFVWVWEIWCRDERKVYFMAKDAGRMLEVSDPFLTFERFYPCPEPAMTTCVDGTRTPIPEVLLIEDQLVDIDNLSKRISALVSALRVRGFYPKGASSSSAADAIETAIRSNDDRQTLIPVEAWAANGAATFEVVWMPIDTVVKVIRECTAMRKEAIDLVYQITGISDVMRGASEASETLGAQQIKAQWGSVRVRSKQAEMSRIARDLCAMTAEIVCELFDPQTIDEMSGYGFDPGMMQFLRDDRMRSLMLDVETDSTIAADETADKQARTEFLTAMGGMIQQMMPVVQMAPELLPMAASMLKFAAAGFRVGRELEGEIDKALEALMQKASAPKPPPQPDPKTMAEIEKTKIEGRVALEEGKAKVAVAQIGAQTAALKAHAEAAKAMAPQVQPQVF